MLTQTIFLASLSFLCNRILLSNGLAISESLPKPLLPLSERADAPGSPQSNALTGDKAEATL